MKEHTITIYGPGCSNCNTLADNTRQAVQSMSGNYEITKISDPLQIAEAGVFQTPALALDGKLLTSGKVMSVEQIRNLLSKATTKGNICCCNNHTPEKPTEPDKAEPSEQSCCCGSSCSVPPEPEQTCSCGAGDSCCMRSGLKTALLLGGLGLMAIAGLRQLQAPQPHEAAPATMAPQAGSTTELVYFTFGKRCPTCERMEQWARAVAEQQQIPFRVQDADEATVAHYGLTTKTLILRHVDNGEEKSWRNLDRIWELSRDEAAYKQYVAKQITQP